MPDGGCLTVSTRCEGDRVEIVVDDTGPGVPPELHEKVLEPFFSTKVTGTGLGLPLVREIVAAHGGFTLHSLLARARVSRCPCLSSFRGGTPMAHGPGPLALSSLPPLKGRTLCRRGRAELRAGGEC